MKITLSAEPNFSLPLTLQQVKLIAAVSENHYDGTCRAASQVGGFIYGWINYLTFAAERRTPDETEPDTVQATWRQLDSVMKICEMGHLQPADQAAEIQNITTHLHRAMEAAREIVPTWERVIETEPASA